MPAARDLYLTSFKLVDSIAVLCAIGLSGSVMLWVQGDGAGWDHIFQMQFRLLDVALFVGGLWLWSLLLWRLGAYAMGCLERGHRERVLLLQAMGLGIIGVGGIGVLLPAVQVRYEALLLVALVGYVLTWWGRAGLRSVRRGIGQRWRERRKLLLVGPSRRAAMVAQYFVNRPFLGFDVLGYLGPPAIALSVSDVELRAHDEDGSPHADRAGLPHLGGVDDLDAVLAREVVDEVLVCLPVQSYYESIQTLLHACEEQGLQAHLLCDFFPLSVFRPHFVEVEGVSVLTLRAV